MLDLRAALLVAATPLAAETDPAIGRLNHAGHRERVHCTVALVGPSEALTAAHCIDGLPIDALHVVLGYDRGDYAEHLRVRSAEAAEGLDIVRLCLDAPAEAEPLGVGGPLAAAMEAVGYPRSQAHRQRRYACAEIAADEREVVVDCVLEPGMSGAPLLAEGRVGGVVSAGDATHSVAILPAALPEGSCEAP